VPMAERGLQAHATGSVLPAVRPIGGTTGVSCRPWQMHIGYRLIFATRGRDRERAGTH